MQPVDHLGIELAGVVRAVQEDVALAGGPIVVHMVEAYEVDAHLLQARGDGGGELFRWEIGPRRQVDTPKSKGLTLTQKMGPFGHNRPICRFSSKHGQPWGYNRIVWR